MSQPEAQQSPRLVRACRGETLDRPPVWMMRQAGRYMPEYMAIRNKVSFLDLCKTPDLAAEVSLQPYKAFGMDGVIMFSDILIPPEAMGMEVVFGDGGPTFTQPLRSRADIERLTIPDPNEKTGFVMDVLKLLRSELSNDPQTALIGFAGAPWTLATYMIEGGGSKNFTHIKKFLYNDPDSLRLLLDKLSQTVSLYLNAQIEAGAQVVQLFDTWGGILPVDLYRQFIQPYHQQIISSLPKDKVPVILYVNNSPHLLEAMAETGANVISLDTLTSLSDARDRLISIKKPDIALQGNLDPNALFGDPAILKTMTESLIGEGGNKGYIFNLGHGILPGTPVENVRLVADTVKNSAKLLAGVS